MREAQIPPFLLLLALIPFSGAGRERKGRKEEATLEEEKELDDGKV